MLGWDITDYGKGNFSELGTVLFTLRNEYGIFFKQNPGGAPCNTLAMAQKLGSKTAFIGKVGSDQFGIYLRDILEAQKIDVSGLIVTEEYPMC